MSAPGRKRLSDGRRIAVIDRIGSPGDSLSDLGLFRDLERVLDLDAEVTGSALQLCVIKQQPDRPEVLRPPRLA
jgi:hypothetical protein